MFIRKFIKDQIPPLKISDTGDRALKWMNEFRLSHLPVLDGRKYLGMINESDVMKQKDLSQALSTYNLPFDRVFIYENQHIYDALKFVSENKYAVIPVLNSENNYIGLLTVIDIVEYIAELSSVKMPGGVIVIEVDTKDYSLASIAQVIEANEGIILNSSVNATPNPAKLDLTIKVNRIDLTRTLAALYRLNYHVIATYHESEFSDDIQDRFDSFMNYLNV